MCIFHELTVKGLSGSEGVSMLCMGLPGNTEAPLATCLSDYIHVIKKMRAGACAWLAIYSIILLLCFYSIMTTGDY